MRGRGAGGAHGDTSLPPQHPLHTQRYLLKMLTVQTAPVQGPLTRRDIPTTLKIKAMTNRPNGQITGGNPPPERCSQMSDSDEQPWLPPFLLALFQHCANTGRAKRPSSALSRNYDMNTVAQTVRRLRQSSTGRRRLRFTYLYCDPSRIYAHWCPTSPAEPISTHTQVRGKNIHAPGTLYGGDYTSRPPSPQLCPK